MTEDRFTELAEAYGGAIARWPAGEQGAARAHLAAEPKAQAILDEALALDAFLDGAAAAAPSAVLRERIIALAPRRQRPLWRRSTTWVSGAGLAAACMLGVMVGVNLSSSVLGDPSTDTVIEASTAFDGLTYLDGLETAG